MSDSNPVCEASAADAGAITAIYNHYIAHSTATFETVLVSEADIAARIARIRGSGHLWLVYREQNEIAGYAYSCQWKERAAYRFAAEVSVYIAHDRLGRGIGAKLYRELFRRLETTSVHTLIACLTIPNPASVALHEKLGMTKVGHFAEVGYKFDRWLDVGYWQKRSRGQNT